MRDTKLCHWPFNPVQFSFMCISYKYNDLIFGHFYWHFHQNNVFWSSFILFCFFLLPNIFPLYGYTTYFSLFQLWKFCLVSTLHYKCCCIKNSHSTHFSCINVKKQIYFCHIEYMVLKRKYWKFCNAVTSFYIPISIFCKFIHIFHCFLSISDCSPISDYGFKLCLFDT